MTADKLEALRALLRSFESCLVAYSGGVDSVLLAFVARQTLGARSLAVLADSPSLPRAELEEARAIAERFEIPLRVVGTSEFANPSYTSNPVNRCFFCKEALFTELLPIARAEGFAVVAYGENASDVGDHRPGALAATQFQVRAPLKEAGLTKSEIRQLSAELGLPTADKPQMACLSSRVPYGEPVTPEKLRMIEQAEAFLKQQGFYDVRVRHHELPELGGNPKNGGSANRPRALARIEVGRGELNRLLTDGLIDRVSAALLGFGYTHVTVDLEGYRRGSLNTRQPA